MSTWSGFDGLGPDRSAQHRSVKRLRRLVRQTKARSSERAFVVEGTKLVDEAQRSGLDVEELFICPDDSVVDVVVRAQSMSTDVHLLRPELLRSSLDAVNPQPVAAIVSSPSWEISDLRTDAPVLVGVELQNPGNVGTVIRTAEAAGCAGVVLCTPTVDCLNPKAVRAAAGSLFRLPVVTTTFNDALAVFRRQQRSVIATVPSADANYDEIDVTTAALLLGNEPRGLASDVIDCADMTVSIPMGGEVESLNVAAAAAVLAFEAQRQARSRRTV